MILPAQDGMETKKNNNKKHTHTQVGTHVGEDIREDGKKKE